MLEDLEYEIEKIKQVVDNNTSIIATKIQNVR